MLKGYENCSCCSIYGTCSECINCKPGYYNGEYNQTECKPCNAGSFST